MNQHRPLIALIFALSACGIDTAPVQSDAAQTAADAATEPGIDAAPVGHRGCMGNLPFSRTITINTGDPIPASLLNELQDNIVGAKRASVKHQIWIPCWEFNGDAPAIETSEIGSASLVPSWKVVDVTGGGSMLGRIPFEPGSRLDGLEVEVFGDGAADYTAAAFYMANPGVALGSAVATVTRNNDPASWGLRNVPLVGSPVSLPDSSGVLAFRISWSGGTLRFGHVIPQMSRP